MVRGSRVLHVRCKSVDERRRRRMEKRKEAKIKENLEKCEQRMVSDFMNIMDPAGLV